MGTDRSVIAHDYGGTSSLVAVPQCLHQGLNRQRRIPLAAIVDNHVDLPILRHGLLDEVHSVPSHLGQLPHDLVIRFGPLLRSLIAHLQRSEESQHGERSGEAFHLQMLRCQWRHVTPMIVDMRDAMLFERGSIFWSDESCIPNLHRVPKVCGELGEESIEACTELLGALAVALEFEEKGAGVGVEVGLAIRREGQILEECRIEKTGVELSRFGPIAALPRKLRDRNLLPDLETHFEIFWDLIQVVPELIRRGGTVEGRVVAHRSKERLALVLILAVFP